MSCVFIWLPHTRNCSCRLAKNHSCHVCLPSCHVHLTAVAIHNVGVSCGRKVVRPHAHKLAGWLCGEKLVRPHSIAGNSVMRGVWANSPTPTHQPCPTWHTKSTFSCQDSCKRQSTTIQACGRVGERPHVWALVFPKNKAM